MALAVVLKNENHERTIPQDEGVFLMIGRFALKMEEHGHGS